MRHAIGARETRHSRLQADGAIARRAVLEGVRNRGLDGLPVGVAIHQAALAAGPSEQLV